MTQSWENLVTDEQTDESDFIGHYPINPLNANPTKWSNTLKQFVGNLPTNCLSVFDHYVNLAFKGLTSSVQHDSVKDFL